MAFLERQRLAHDRAFFPFACLLAQHRNLAPFVKHDRQYSPEDFMPKHPITKAGLARGVGPEVAAEFIRVAEENARA
jgi:hypothetical protein